MQYQPGHDVWVRGKILLQETENAIRINVNDHICVASPEDLRPAEPIQPVKKLQRAIQELIRRGETLVHCVDGEKYMQECLQWGAAAEQAMKLLPEPPAEEEVSK